MAGLRAPGRKGDYITTGFVAAFCVLLITGNAILIKNRAYRPIRTRGVILTVLSSIGGLIWIASTIVVYNLLSDRHKPVLRICSLWTFWLQGCCGFALWLNCLTVRMFQLHYVMVRRLPVPKTFATFKLIVCPLFVLLLPAMILCGIASAVHGTKLERDGKFYDCIVRKGFAFALIAFGPLYFSIFIFLAFTLRNVLRHWNEYRQLRRGGIASFFIFLLWLVTVKSGTHHTTLGRCFMVLAVTATVSYYFWVRNWEVIYNVLVDKEGYGRRFGEELNRFDEVSSRFPWPAAAQADPTERLVLQMVDDAREYRQKVDNLVQEIADLQNRVDRSPP